MLLLSIVNWSRKCETEYVYRTQFHFCRISSKAEQFDSRPILSVFKSQNTHLSSTDQLN